MEGSLSKSTNILLTLFLLQACHKCGRSFADRSNCTSHEKKCKVSSGSTTAAASAITQSATQLLAAPGPAVSIPNTIILSRVAAGSAAIGMATGEIKFC